MCLIYGCHKSWNLTLLHPAWSNILCRRRWMEDGRIGESSFLGEGNTHRESASDLYFLITFRAGGDRIRLWTAAFVFGSQITTSGPLVPARLLVRSSTVSRFRSSHWWQLAPIRWTGGGSGALPLLSPAPDDRGCNSFESDCRQCYLRPCGHLTSSRHRIAGYHLSSACSGGYCPASA